MAMALRIVSLTGLEEVVRTRAGRQGVDVDVVDSVRNAPRMLSVLKALEVDYEWEADDDDDIHRLRALCCDALPGAGGARDIVVFPRLCLEPTNARGIANLPLPRRQPHPQDGRQGGRLSPCSGDHARSATTCATSPPSSGARRAPRSGWRTLQPSPPTSPHLQTPTCDGVRSFGMAWSQCVLLRECLPPQMRSPLDSSLMLSLPALLIGACAFAAAAVAASGDGCRAGCPLAIAAYYFSEGSNLTFIATIFAIGGGGGGGYQVLLPYNPAITNPDYVVTGDRVLVPFPCSCLGLPAAPASTFLAGAIPYPLPLPRGGDTYDAVAANYANLTTAAWLEATNAYPPGRIPASVRVNVTINCSCGDERVSPRYGLFLTYPLWDGETLESVAAQYGFSSPAEMELIRRYNPGMGGVSGKGIVFIPVKGNSLSGGAIAGIVIACIATFIVAIWLIVMFYRWQKFRKATSHPSPEETSHLDDASQAEGIKVERSIEYSYEEIFNATQGFSMEHKIGQGGFGSVYYAELRGEKTAIKKMGMQATQEFLAELKVLTHVHHLNLVRLIGYCVENCLFLVYEFIDNGNLSQHLQRTGYEPLSWATRVQIALDSARGLEYLHEHVVPVYVHRDIKSANILLDKDFRAKVADFGLAKLTEVGSMSQSLPTRVAGTFGYMPPEARYGEVSPKVDVYAFGVVLYELLSAKQAIVRSSESVSESKGLVFLFEEALSALNPTEALDELIDPSLQGDYPVDSALKIASLAKSCTHEEPGMRPTMRSVVVALMALTANTDLRDMDYSPV
uniref:non-specific serine/threonine protein kinase n=1 Tax=Oryza meridionalis TaxID=40149 RepID=A0A0E0EH21_9ORYZ